MNESECLLKVSFFPYSSSILQQYFLFSIFLSMFSNKKKLILTNNNNKFVEYLELNIFVSLLAIQHVDHLYADRRGHLPLLVSQLIISVLEYESMCAHLQALLILVVLLYQRIFRKCVVVFFLLFLMHIIPMKRAFFRNMVFVVIF